MAEFQISGETNAIEDSGTFKSDKKRTDLL